MIIFYVSYYRKLELISFLSHLSQVSNLGKRNRKCISIPSPIFLAASLNNKDEHNL